VSFGVLLTSERKMAFFTTEDTNNLMVLIDHHKVIYRRNALLMSLPNVGSHTVLRVKRCTDEYVYRDPVHVPSVDKAQHLAREDLEELAIVTDWKFTPTGCDHVVSCNPFYPHNKRCAGMASYKRGDDGALHETPKETGPHDTAFSFKTSNGQMFDACQPACYDKAAQSLNNMVGVTTRFTFGKCRVYDPMLLALYLDPTRRYVNPDTQILERRSFVVKDVLIEPYTDEAVLLASIPRDYCDQYAESYKADGQEQGISMYKCGDNPLVWATSWLVGESLPKLATVAYDKIGSGHVEENDIRYPPSRSFLASRKLWMEYSDTTKKRLPFPLRLVDLGIVRGTVTEWLVWTDEFSHLTDGRNDMYGGRLVDRDRPVPVSLKNKQSLDAVDAARDDTYRVLLRRTRSTHARVVEDMLQNGDRHTLVDGADIESTILKSLSRGAQQYQTILTEDIERHRVSLLGVGAGVAYGVGYTWLAEALELPSSLGVLKSAFSAIRHAPSYARKAALTMIGFWSAKATAAHVAEATATRFLVTRLKHLAFVQALGPVALIIDVVALVGTTIDIIYALLTICGVSTPISRRQFPASDRCLYRLAQNEIETNRRLFGTGNIELTPSRFVVNTPFITPEQDVRSFMAVMPIIYAARELNSNGGLLKPDQTDDGEFELGPDGRVQYIKNGLRHSDVLDENVMSAALDDTLRRSIKLPVPVQDNNEAITNPFWYYIMAVLFVTVCMVGYCYPEKGWAFVLVLLLSILSIAFPMALLGAPNHKDYVIPTRRT